ncbi:hypothetical protein Hz2V071 [Helicoverpa zea nudivirus 2]|uniref:Uncharacterized protein n=1 Tax=Helicoverpa zea nudivirus 2 TaxID=1128424 RepID=G9I097_HZNV2|nr:orf71 gene product [Helicoverpa zea nudivirus 2]AEW69620.1 hypothetical protein Hz2V071 [Helicoverpa zea nudivirus 2]
MNGSFISELYRNTKPITNSEMPEPSTVAEAIKLYTKKAMLGNSKSTVDDNVKSANIVKSTKSNGSFKSTDSSTLEATSAGIVQFTHNQHVQDAGTLQPLHKPCILMVEYPYTIRSTYASLDHDLVIVDSDLQHLRINILHIEQPLIIDDIEDHLVVDADRISWSYDEELLEDETVQTFRYYAAVQLDHYHNEMHELRQIADTLYQHSKSLLTLRPTTIRSKLNLGTYTRCPPNAFPCSIVWAESVTVSNPGFNLVLMSKVPAISNSKNDPYNSLMSVNLTGVPMQVEKFTERCINHYTCMMHNADDDANLAVFQHSAGESSNFSTVLEGMSQTRPDATRYLSTFFSTLSDKCFDCVYEMTRSCVRLNARKWIHIDRGVPYTILLRRSGIPHPSAPSAPSVSNLVETVHLVDTERCIDSYIATFHRMKFYKIEIHPFGLYSMDEMGNIMYVGVVDKVFTLSGL